MLRSGAYSLELDRTADGDVTDGAANETAKVTAIIDADGKRIGCGWLVLNADNRLAMGAAAGALGSG